MRNVTGQFDTYTLYVVAVVVIVYVGLSWRWPDIFQ